jgi:hypothetical protein
MNQKPFDQHFKSELILALPMTIRLPEAPTLFAAKPDDAAPLQPGNAAIASR